MLLIGQLHYATTPKYNFPQQILEYADLPRKIIELSLNSMSEIRNGYFQPWMDSNAFSTEKIGFQEDVIEVYGKEAFSVISSLEPISDDSTIIAIDASSIKVGETENGVICAVRGAVVWNKEKRYRYLRFGPLPFYITEENKREILNLLECHWPIGSISKISFLIEMQSRLCSMLERWIQIAISSSTNNSIILLDGALVSNGATRFLSDILKIARENSNIILSFSKASTIRFFGKKITDLVIRQKAPCLLELDEHMLSLASRKMRFHGKIYVAKLNDRGYPFRVDIDGALPRDLQIIAVRRLLGNELMFQGYPETLRLAHIFSTFTASDVIGIQHFITEKYRLKIIAVPSIRKALFGPFGTGGIGD